MAIKKLSQSIIIRTELKNLLEKEDIDVLFLTETDSNNLDSESDYIIQGYKTILPLKKNNSDKVRILCLVMEAISSQVKPVPELMNPSFPSIWIEIKGNFDTNSGNDMIIGGFYREWAQKGILAIAKMEIKKFVKTLPI